MKKCYPYLVLKYVLLLIVLLNGDPLKSQTFCERLCEGDFEIGYVTPCPPHQTTITCWKTPAANGYNLMEIWGTGCDGVTAYDGNNFTEVNADVVSYIYQNFVGTAGSAAVLSFAHRGRYGTDVVNVSVGPPAGPFTSLGDFSAGNTGWTYNELNITLPANSSSQYRLKFTAVSSSNGNLTQGNFLDAVSLKTPAPIVQATTVNPTCSYTQDGSIALTVTTGTAPFSYYLQPGGSGAYHDHLGPGTYAVMVTDAGGCPAISTVVLLPGPGSITNISAGICEGESYAFNGTNYTTAGSYQASYPVSAVCDSIVNLQLSVYQPYLDTQEVLACGAFYTYNGVEYSGTQTVVYQTVHGCDSAIVLVPYADYAFDLPVASDSVICPGESVQFTLDITTPIHDNVSFLWTPASRLNDPTIPNPVAVINETTTFSVTITTACNQFYTEITIEVADPGDVFTDGDTSVCRGHSVQLSATGGISYVWSPATGLNDPASGNPIATPVVPTMYYVDVTMPAGCVFRDSVMVDVFFILPSPAMPDTLAICFGTSATVHVSGADTYAWASLPGISPLTGETVTISPAADATYYCDFTNSCGTVRDSLFADVIVPDIGAGSDTSICPGGEAVLFAFGGVAYAWSPAGTVTPHSGAEVVASPSESTVYRVIGKDQSGCKDTAFVSVTVFPHAFIQACPDVYTSPGEEIQLSAVSTTPGPFVWSPSEYLSCVVCEAPTALPEREFTYTVSYTDTNGCSASDEVSIYYDAFLYIPNTFTPDGNTVNDAFKASGVNVSEFELFIYDRWGEQVCRLASFDDGWDGTFGGKICPDGTYAWEATYIDLRNNVKVVNGHITLLR